MDEKSQDLSTRKLRREAAERVVKVWRAVGDGNDDELLARYIIQTIEAGQHNPKNNEGA